MTVRDTPWPDGTPCWVDLMTSDQQAANAFYAELFGWQVVSGPPETGGYAMAEIDGRAVAGIGGTMGMDHPPVWNTYLATADADAICDAAVRAGGTVFAPVMDVMGFGRMAVLQDSAGAAFSIWQPGSHLGFGVANEPNAVSWNELLTRDYSAAIEFYAGVFGYSFTDLSGGGMQYSTIELGGRPVGGIGGMPAAIPAEVPSHWRVYFSVGDCDATVAKVQSLGGSVRQPPQDMPYGRHADVVDPQGAPFSVVKPVNPDA